MEIKPEEYSRRQLKESKFKKGIVEEVSRDDKGYKGVWFLDTVVDIIGKDRFQVEYRDLKTNGGTQLLKEEIDARLIRPCPPEVSFAGPFKQFQEVDAWYNNDGWWEAVAHEVLNSRECLYKDYQFDGKWVMPSKVKKLLLFIITLFFGNAIDIINCFQN